MFNADAININLNVKAKKDGADETIAKYDGQWSIEPLEKDPLKG